MFGAAVTSSVAVGGDRGSGAVATKTAATQEALCSTSRNVGQIKDTAG